MWNPLNFSEPQLAGGGTRGKIPPSPWTCWARHIKSVDGVVFFRLSYFGYSDLQLFLPFTYSRSIFRRHISWKMLKRAFQSLQIWKFSWGGYPQLPPTRFVPSALEIVPPVTKNLATALLLPRHKTLTNLFPMRIEPSSTGKILRTLSTRPILECKGPQTNILLDVGFLRGTDQQKSTPSVHVMGMCIAGWGRILRLDGLLPKLLL